ncbi:hypothetical protein KJ596_04330 [Patescibacteria group bacterium]|nr:hypothetical protein [Patescibacteria group bacterium]MBU1868312.1 hypothetical protein [Patescibacteria group bacterium]
MSENNQQDITKKVMDEIQEKGVVMRPRWYFIGGSILLVVGLTFSFVIAVFLVNIISLRLRIDVPFEFLRFGRSGLGPFLLMLPWPFLLVAVIAILTGLYLLKKYDFSYKHNFLIIAVITIISVFFSGVILDWIGTNQLLADFRPVRGFYREVLPGRDWVAGEVLEVDDNQIRIETLQGETVTILWDTAIIFPTGHVFKLGQHVRAFGEPKDGVLQAKGITTSRFLKRPTFYPRPHRPF